MKVEVWGERGDVKIRWWVDREKLREMCRLKGRYLLVTDHPELSALEMLETYKDKDKVEKRFRVAKGVLRVRPIYLHKDERIAAMLMVNMIAGGGHHLRWSIPWPSGGVAAMDCTSQPGKCYMLLGHCT